MEGFKNILGTIGGGLGTFGKGLGGAGQALSPVTSLFGLIQQFSQAQKEKALLDRSIYYSKHPEAISNLATAMTKPLDVGLTKGVSNIVNASLAEQGLSQAPGIQSQVFAQALAPYMQQNQQLALREALAAVGMPLQTLETMQLGARPDDLASMLKGILPGDPSANIGPILRRIGISEGGGGPQTTPSTLPDETIPYPGVMGDIGGIPGLGQ